MRFLALTEVLELHRLVLQQSGGSTGVRDLGTLQSAIAQPGMTFGGQDLYPNLESKTTALCFSLVSNHPFIDGNKRIGHAAMETFLIMNGFELDASIDDAEKTMLTLAAGELTREGLLTWVREHVRPLSKPYSASHQSSGRPDTSIPGDPDQR